MYFIRDKKRRYLKIDGSKVFLKSPLFATRFKTIEDANKFCPKDCVMVFLSDKTYESFNKLTPDIKEGE